MFRGRRVLAAVLLLTVLGTATARAQVPLPPPPSLPAPNVPAGVEPIIAVASPTAGPVCGTVSLLTLLAPSLAEGYLKIPLSKLIDSATFRSYGNTALYVCGFVPFSLTPTQCNTDRQIVDALRGLNPLAAQVVGLFPEGASVDTVLAIEKLLPQSESVAGPLVDQLSAVMGCTRSSGAPPTSAPPTGEPLPPAAPAPVAAAPSAAPEMPEPRAAAAAIPTVAPSSPAPPAAAPVVGGVLPTVFETVLRHRTGTQWLGIVLGMVLLGLSAGAWLWARPHGRPPA